MPAAPVIRTVRPFTQKAREIFFIAANVTGVISYLVLASRGWRDPLEHGMIPVTGEPFVWVLAVPVFVISIFMDLIWAALLLREGKSKRMLWLLVTAVVWLIAIRVDFAHH